MAELNKAVEESLHGKTPKYQPGEIRPFPHPPLLLTAASFPPAVSFYTLPQLHIWKDWIKGIPGYRFGANRVPSGSFDDADKILSAGWTDISHQCDGVVKKITVPKRERIPVAKDDPKKKKARAVSKKNDIKYEDEQLDEDEHVLKLSVEPADPKKVDELDPYLDEPAAAVLSPPVRVGANNLVRISVLVRRPMGNLGGKAGVIIRDSIGGEQFQFRSAGPIPAPLSRGPLSQGAGRRRRAASCSPWRATARSSSTTSRSRSSRRISPIAPSTPGSSSGGRPDRASPRLPDPRTPAAAALPSTTRRKR